jgi:hypothetical protein
MKNYASFSFQLCYNYIKKISVYLILSFILLFISCSPKKTTSSEIDLIFPKEISLTSSIFINHSILPYSDIRLLHDSLILLITAMDEFDYLFFDIKNTKQVHSFGRKGHGPGEYFMPSVVINQSNNTDKFKIIMANRIDSYNLDSLLNTNEYLPNSIKIENCPFFNNVTEVIPETYVGIGFFEQGMYGLIKDDKFMGTYLEYPFNEQYENIPNSFMGDVYQGYIQSQPNGTRIVAAFFNAGLIQFLNLDDKGLSLVNQIITYLPQINIITVGGGAKTGVAAYGTPRGYTGLAVTSNYVYAIYSGIIPESNKELDSFYGNNLLVFDWDGTPLIRFVLNERISGLVVDEKDMFAYSLNINGDLIQIPIKMNSQIKQIQ